MNLCMIKTSHNQTWLNDMEGVFGSQPGLYEALMFMTPDDQVKERVKKALRNVICKTMFSVVLMQNHDVEPIFHRFSGAKHFYLK